MPLWACGVVVRNHCRPGRAPAGLCHVYLPASVGQPTRQHLDSRWTIKSNKSSIMCFPCPLSPLTMLKGGAAHLVSLVRFILYHGRGSLLSTLSKGRGGKATYSLTESSRSMRHCFFVRFYCPSTVGPPCANMFFRSFFCGRVPENKPLNPMGPQGSPKVSQRYLLMDL